MVLFGESIVFVVWTILLQDETPVRHDCLVVNRTSKFIINIPSRHGCWGVNVWSPAGNYSKSVNVWSLAWVPEHTPSIQFNKYTHKHIKYTRARANRVDSSCFSLRSCTSRPAHTIHTRAR